MGTFKIFAMGPISSIGSHGDAYGWSLTIKAHISSLQQTQTIPQEYCLHIHVLAIVSHWQIRNHCFKIVT